MRTFQEYDSAGFGDDLLPNLPPDAAIHPKSPHFGELAAKRGKVPGRKFPGGWFGFRDWTQYTPEPADFPIWQSWGASIGMQGRRFPALDIDVVDEELANAIHEAATLAFGVAPCRFGRGARRLLVFAGAGLGKRRLAFCQAGVGAGAARSPGEHATALLDALEPQAVEFLAAGQQYVVDGIHPKTGRPYYWRDGQSPVEVGAANLVAVDAAQLDAFFDGLEALVASHGYAVVSHITGRAGGLKVAQDSLLAPSPDAIRRAMAALPNEVDYDGWLKVGAALKAAAGPEHQADAYELFLDWSLKWPTNTPEGVEAKWESLRPPFKVGWDFLSRFATEHGDGTFFAAQEDFDAVGPAPLPGQESKGPLISDKVQAVFDRYTWIEGLKRLCDLQTGALLDREQFNVRHSELGDPTSTKDCAWAVLTRDKRRLQTAEGLTYRPGQGPLVDENLPGLTGRCVNQWTDTTPHLPSAATDEDVAPWLNHVGFVLPRADEREVVLNWLAWVIQNPGLKPNWALVIGSTYEGMGKDLMMEPVRVALGKGNVREITPDDLASDYNGFLVRARLLFIEEMQVHERKAMMNRLKPLLAAPPHTLRVNIKFQPQYEIPNSVAAVFFTNMENALAITGQDRRYFVTWNDGEPRGADYYGGLVAWYAAGGAEMAARWLIDRDVAGFNPQGRAPDTEAKTQMRKAALPELEAAIQDAVAIREGPFRRRLVTMGEVSAWVRDLLGPYRPPGPRRLSAALKAAGALRSDKRPQLGAVPAGCQRPPAYDRKQMWLYAMPGDGAALDLIDDLPALRAAFWADRQTVDDDFAQDPIDAGAQ